MANQDEGKDDLKEPIRTQTKDKKLPKARDTRIT